MVSVTNTTQPATILKVFLAEANSDFFNKTSKNLVHCVLNAYIAQILQSQRNPLEKKNNQSLSSNTDPKPVQSQPPPPSLTICGEKVHMVADGLLHGAFKSLVGGSDG